MQHPEPDLCPEKEKQHTNWCAVCWQREKDQSPLRGLRNSHLRCIKWVRVRIPLEKKEKQHTEVCCLWQREKDSNPHKQSQSLLCYLYTIPLRA